MDAETVDILCVDDDEVDVLGIQREFNKVNALLKIAVACNGNEGLNKLYGREGENRIRPRIILLDINMPKMNGIEFLKTLREDAEFSGVEVFILTGSYSTKDKLAMQDLNVRGHIIKPLGYGDALNVFWALQA